MRGGTPSGRSFERLCRRRKRETQQLKTTGGGSKKAVRRFYFLGRRRRGFEKLARQSDFRASRTKIYFEEGVWQGCFEKTEQKQFLKGCAVSIGKDRKESRFWKGRGLAWKGEDSLPLEEQTAGRFGKEAGKNVLEKVCGKFWKRARAGCFLKKGSTMQHEKSVTTKAKGESGARRRRRCRGKRTASLFQRRRDAARAFTFL